MSGITRQSILRGPGRAKFGSVVLHDADGIEADVDLATKEVRSSVAGLLDTIRTGLSATVRLTPVGSLDAAIVAALFPHQSPVFGASLFGSSDTALEIHSVAGTKVVFHSAALLKPPELRLSPVETSFGQCEFGALLANGKEPGDTGAFVTVSSAAYSGNPPSRDGLTAHAYSAEWGDLDIPDTLDGWTVTVELATEDVTADRLGVIDKTLAGVTVRAKCTPIGLAESQIAAALALSSPRGSSAAGTNDLVISSADGLVVTLRNAALVEGPLRWGATALRAGEIGFVANLASDGSLYSVELAAGDDDGGEEE